MSAAPNVRAEPRLVFHSASRSHPGARRALNDDRVLDRPGLWAVADGMGGHSAGGEAATRVIAALEAIEHGHSGYAYLDDVAAAVARTNAALFAERDIHGQVSGATLVALLAHEGHYACLWAGDSRAYMLRDNRLSRITHDHSVVQQLIDADALQEEDRGRHPSANLVTRAVGADASLSLDRRFAAIQAGDVFLLCSDGLTACVHDHELEQILRGADGAETADQLLETALSRNAPDNVSLIIIRAGAQA